ncbi:MAG: Gfo/Idh/MocA family oxidoreductase [Gammaproteobacteria bacterium]
MKICVVGEGAISKKHLDGLSKIEDAEVVSLVGGVAADTEAVAKKYNIPFWTLDLDEGINRAGVEAVIIGSPTPIHAKQAIHCLQAGKHVEIEVPIADSLADAQAVLETQKQTGLIAMGGHTRRFNPSHQYIHNKIVAGDLKIQQMDVQTYFFRRKNINAEGKPRSWTDHLLWHHAAHTIDLFQYQTGEHASQVTAMQGPIHPELGIAMDMNIGLKVPSGAICTLSLSFNNDGPLGSFFRYICDNGTYIAIYDDLVDGYQKKIDVSKVDVSMNGFELQDREFIAAIKEGREPNASVAQLMPTMEIMHEAEQQLNATNKG